MGGQIENKERKSVGLRRKKRERKEKGEGSYPRRCSKGCSRRCSKEVFVFLLGRKEGVIEIVIKM